MLDPPAFSFISCAFSISYFKGSFFFFFSRAVQWELLYPQAFAFSFSGLLRKKLFQALVDFLQMLPFVIFDLEADTWPSGVSLASMSQELAGIPFFFSSPFSASQKSISVLVI